MASQPRPELIHQANLAVSSGVGVGVREQTGTCGCASRCLSVPTVTTATAMASKDLLIWPNGVYGPAVGCQQQLRHTGLVWRLNGAKRTYCQHRYIIVNAAYRLGMAHEQCQKDILSISLHHCNCLLLTPIRRSKHSVKRTYC